MKNKYHINVERTGVNQVNVSREIDSNNREMVWMFSLDGDDEPIYLKEFYAPAKFLIMNWNGLLRAYDVETQKKIFEKDFKSELDCRASISHDGSKLYISHSHKKDRNKLLTVMSLADFSEINTHTLPEPIKIEYFQERKDGQLLYYYHDENWKDPEKEKWYHGFQVVNPGTGHSENFPMLNAPSDDFDTKAPELNLELNLGVMSDWGDVEFETHEDGKPRFVAKINLFNLDDFTIVNSISVREFKTEHLDVYDSECKKKAEILMSDQRGEDYDEVRNDFNRNLYSIKFVKNEDALWLCFRGAVLRKVSLDGTKKSPLLAAVKLPNGYEQKPFEFRTKRVRIESICDDGLILHEHPNMYWLSLKGIDLNSNREIIPFELQDLPEDKQIKTIVPQTFSRKIEQRGKVVINVANLREEKSIINALDQILKLCGDIGSIRQGNNLIFQIVDKKGNAQEEELFFKEAVQAKGAKEKIRKIIEKFAEYPEAESLYINDEATALCYAVYELAMSDARYIDTALRYMAKMDFEHDVFSRETLIPGLIEKYGDTEHGPYLRIGISLLDLDEAPDMYLFEAYLDKNSAFRKWFNKGGAKEIPVTLNALAKLGMNMDYIQVIFKDASEDLRELKDIFNSPFLKKKKK